MPRTKTATCSKCQSPAWFNSKSSSDKIICHPCRRADPARKGRTVPRDEQLRRMREARMAIRDIVCPCGAIFQGVANRQYCDDCRYQRARNRWRAKNHTRLGYPRAAYRGFKISDVIERDGPDCWLCGDYVNPELKGRHPLMASYDHVIPSSRGGSDRFDNIRLAHLVCNIRRGNKELTA